MIYRESLYILSKPDDIESRYIFYQNLMIYRESLYILSKPDDIKSRYIKESRYIYFIKT